MYVKYLKEFLIKAVFMGFIGGADCMKVALVELQLRHINPYNSGRRHSNGSDTKSKKNPTERFAGLY